MNQDDNQTGIISLLDMMSMDDATWERHASPLTVTLGF